MTTCYVVTVQEPVPYPAFMPKSFAYLRQQLDLLSQFRVNSIIIGEENPYTGNMQFIPFSWKPRKPRFLQYLFDEYLPAKRFVEAVKLKWPKLKIKLKEWKGEK
jgi:hypothetical protein